MIGMEEVRKVAASMAVIGSFSHFRVKIDWELFWLHSLLVAYLTERLANAYREVTGKEYLAGLLHDIGKLFLEHYFAQEFELVIMRAIYSKTGMHEAENQLLDITHAEVGSLLCEKWLLNREIIRAVRFHHEPNAPANVAPDDPNYTPFLTLCVNIADKLANVCHANIQGGEDLAQVNFEELPEWRQLKQSPPRTTLVLDLAVELKKVKDIIAAMKIPSSFR
jgi:putative nucleotidyltransferase with HDIG domain